MIGFFEIQLPWPPASLSGHAKGTWWNSSPVVKAHRAAARDATEKATADVPDDGDINLRILFYPPDHRSDRTNYWNRCKAYIDGVADGLGVNDKRFLPSMEFGFVVPQGRVYIEVWQGDRI